MHIQGAILVVVIVVVKTECKSFRLCVCRCWYNKVVLQIDGIKKKKNRLWKRWFLRACVFMRNMVSQSRPLERAETKVTFIKKKTIKKQKGRESHDYIVSCHPMDQAAGAVDSFRMRWEILAMNSIVRIRSVRPYDCRNMCVLSR